MSTPRAGPSSHEELFDEEPTRVGPIPSTSAGLVVLYAPELDQLPAAYPFHGPELTIGRDAANAVCVPEQAVSRLHARIAFDGRRWTLTDLGSRNGTIVDGVAVREPIELQHLHEIRVGDAVFEFVESGAERFVPYRLDGSVAGERRAKRIDELVGGQQIDAIAADVERIAPTELSCVILGESGTGKELVARALHRVSGRRGAFQAVCCAAIPPHLFEAELFGYRRGAFRGADRDHPGLVALADGGTLFLDDVGDLPLDAQTKLLRVLQAREVFPLGATAGEKVDARIVCASPRDLRAYVRDGKFRGDLLARLDEHVVRLPPLRERKEDVYPLARSFCARYGRAGLAFAPAFMIALLHYDWPFNVRELESCIKRGVALSDGAPLDAQHLPDAIVEAMKTYGGERGRAPAQSLASLPSLLPIDAPEPSSGPASAPAPSTRRPPPTEEELRELLARHRGNVAAVGRELGKERMQVHRWLKRYGISLDDYR